MAGGKGKRTSSANGASKKALLKIVQNGIAALAALEAKLEKEDGLADKTPDERNASTGRLRDGEDAVMINILDTVDKHPGVFQSLAARDHGKDDRVVETGPARLALAERAVLVPLAAKMRALADRVDDKILERAELAKDVTVPAYGIIKANVDVSPELKKSAAPALSYHAKIGKRGASAKKAKAAAKAPKG